MRVLRRALELRQRVSVEIRELEKHVDEVAERGYSRENRLLHLHLERHLAHAYGQAGIWSQEKAAHDVTYLTGEIDQFGPTDGGLESGIVAANEDLRAPVELRLVPGRPTGERSG